MFPKLVLEKLSAIYVRARYGKAPPIFDAAWYVSAYRDVAESNIDPWLHYRCFGAKEGRRANAFFDTQWYLQRYRDVGESEINPLMHYWLYGANEGRDPHAEFSTQQYRKENPDVAASGINPLYHFLKWGQHEGRATTYSTLDVESEGTSSALEGHPHVSAAFEALVLRLAEETKLIAMNDEVLVKIRALIADALRILKDRGFSSVTAEGFLELAKSLDPSGLGCATTSSWVEDFRRTRKTYGEKAALASVLRYLAAISDPLAGMSSSSRMAHPATRKFREVYEYTYSLVGGDKVVPSRRPKNEVDYALEVPFGFASTANQDRVVAAIVHCFYPEVLQDMLGYFSYIPAKVDLYLSTDTPEKAADIERICARSWSKGGFEVRVFPNRGRDVAPKLVGFRDIYEHYDIFLHAHTKKSPHGGEPLSGWRDYLLASLCGSEEIAASALKLFDDPQVGIVFPQHLFELRGILNWGYDFDDAKKLLGRMGIQLDKDRVLEFPSGSMFWGRSAALKKLLDLDLSFEDFPEEAGQIDGTLAHAIERSILFAAERAGYEWRKVIRRDLYPLAATVLPVACEADLAQLRTVVYRPVLGRVDTSVLPSERAIPETRAILTYPSRNPRPRINLLTPTINPSQMFGGVSTAVKVFTDIAQSLGDDHDRRIVATCAPIRAEAVEAFGDYELSSPGPSLDLTSRTLLDVYDRTAGRLDLRDADVFVATAWWTARFAFEFNETRRAMGLTPHPVIYLMQDDEPYFYGWSSKWALAEATYNRPEETIAIINSEELYSVMQNKYNFPKSFVLPYEINQSIKAGLRPTKRERTILIYGRPSVTRNAFEVLLDGIFIWQQRNPVLASQWNIVSLGEAYPGEWAYPVQNFSVTGKASLSEYSACLSSAAVGISLMLSPHPSYPPLEMAEAGLITVTNDFPGKDLARRYPNVISVKLLEPNEIALAIECAVSRAEELVVGVASLGSETTAPARPSGAVYSPSRVADLLRGDRAQ